MNAVQRRGHAVLLAALALSVRLYMGRAAGTRLFIQWSLAGIVASDHVLTLLEYHDLNLAAVLTRRSFAMRRPTGPDGCGGNGSHPIAALALLFYSVGP